MSSICSGLNSQPSGQKRGRGEDPFTPQKGIKPHNHGGIKRARPCNLTASQRKGLILKTRAMLLESANWDGVNKDDFAAQEGKNNFIKSLKRSLEGIGGDGISVFNPPEINKELIPILINK